MHTTCQVVTKPWGHEVIWARTDRYMGKLLVINPDCKLSRQYHEYKDESFYVLKGAMTLEVGYPDDDNFETMIMGPGNSFHCPPGTIHRMCAGTDGCEVVEASSSESDAGDIVRLEDDYDR